MCVCSCINVNIDDIYLSNSCLFVGVIDGIHNYMDHSFTVPYLVMLFLFAFRIRSVFGNSCSRSRQTTRYPHSKYKNRPTVTARWQQGQRFVCFVAGRLRDQPACISCKLIRYTYALICTHTWFVNTHAFHIQLYAILYPDNALTNDFVVEYYFVPL